MIDVRTDLYSPPGPESIARKIESNTAVFDYLQEIGNILGRGYTVYIYDENEKIIGKRSSAKDTNAIYTGDGLCIIAAAVVSEAVKRKFGDSIQVAPRRIYAADKDLVKTPENYFVHWITIVGNDENAFLIDTTGYQGDMTKPARKAFITPVMSLYQHYDAVPFLEVRHAKVEEINSWVYDEFNTHSEKTQLYYLYECLVKSITDSLE